MTRPLPLVFFALALVLPAFAADPAPASSPPAAPDTKLSAPELAYWRQLQKELLDLRSANLAAGIRAMPMEAKPDQLSAIASRLEEFLDRHEKDPIDQLGPDLQEYRERVMKLLDAALTPVTAAVKFKSSLVANGEERMQTVMTNSLQVAAIDDHKPRLAALHEKINARVLASGGESRLFFGTLGLGDKPREPGSLATFEERDAQFLKEAAAIGEVFGAIAKGDFVDNRVATGLSEGLMKPVMDNIENFRTQFAETPTDQLKEALDSAGSLKEEPGAYNSKRRLVQLELMHREDAVQYALAMQEFQGAFQRWIGKADDILPPGMCRDIAVASDANWFAYTRSEKEIVVRSASDGKILKIIPSDYPVRALVGASDLKLLVFSADGLFETDPAADEPSLELRAARKSAFLEPRIARSRDGEHYIYALGVMPAIATGNGENTMSLDKATSRITSVAMNADGKHFAIGYAGDNLTGNGEPNYGFLLVDADTDSAGHLAGTEIKGRAQTPPLRAATLDLSLSADGKKIAAAYYGPFAGMVTLDDFAPEKPTRQFYSLDGEPYTWVRYLEGGKPRVVAGTRNGVVRVWDAASRELLVRFPVPAGPSGVAYALLGDDVVSVALGQPGVHRWKISDGTLVASYDGETPAADAKLAAEKLAAERALAPTRDLILAMLDTPDADIEKKLKAIDSLRGEHAADVAALNQKSTIDHILAGLRSQQIFDLGKNQRANEGFEIGSKEIDGGLLDPYLVYITLYTGNRADDAVHARVFSLAERAAKLYPNDTALLGQVQRARYYEAFHNNNTAAAFKALDELDVIEPAQAPHSSYRYDAYMLAYQNANTAGRTRDAMQALIDAYPHTEEKSEHLMLANNIFALACKLEDWKMALNSANMVLQLDESMKNNESFMQWARIAYQKVNGNK